MSKTLMTNDLPESLRKLVRDVARGNVLIELTVHAGEMTLLAGGIMSGSAEVSQSEAARANRTMLPEKHWMGEDGESRSTRSVRFTAGAVARRFPKRGSKDRVRVDVDVVVPADVKAFPATDLTRICAVGMGYPYGDGELGQLAVSLDAAEELFGPLPGQEEVRQKLLAEREEGLATLVGPKLCPICNEAPEFDNTGACRWESCENIAEALETLPASAELTAKHITLEPTPGAVWNTGTIPSIGDRIKLRIHYPANGRGVAVPPGTVGRVIGYFAEGVEGHTLWQYVITQFPGKAAIVAAVDIVRDEVAADDARAEAEALRAAGVL